MNAQRRAEPNRWAVLAVLGLAQLMVVLDGTIVNVALPTAESDLHFSTANRQWIITAYALAFGSLLLLGGKIGDLFGRKWTFIAGLIGFAVASMLGGLAQSFGVLVGARTLQGTFAALLAPSALSLLTVTFANSPDRAKAFGIYGALAGAGASVGLLLGGFLTQTLSWRWCLYVNLFIAIPTAIFAFRLLVNQAHPNRPRIDMPGVIVASAGLFALVFGFSNAATKSWTTPLTIVSLAAGAGLLVAFVLVEQRTANPLLPLHIVWNRTRGGAYASIGVAASCMYAVFLFLTFYMQRTLGFAPITTGLAFLPMTLAIVSTATTVQTRLLRVVGAQRIVTFGMLMGVIAMVFFTRLTVDGSYVTHVLPGLMIVGVSMGCIFATCYGTATLGVDHTEAGVASAMINTSQQVGASVGTAMLSTLFAAAATSFAAGHARTADLADAAAVHGYTTAFWWAAGIFGVGLLVALFVLPAGTGLRARQAQAAAAAAGS